MQKAPAVFGGGKEIGLLDQLKGGKGLVAVARLKKLILAASELFLRHFWLIKRLRRA
jgi:hypothetical protein